MTSAPTSKLPKPGLNIYGLAAVNPYKITIAAEEIGVPYNYITLDASTGELQSDWYKAVNPNGRAPAIVHIREDGTSVTVFESEACLMYLATELDKEHKLTYIPGTPEFWTQSSWLSWQAASYSTLMAEAIHFNRFAAEPVPYGVWRYTAEARRLFGVLDEQLSASSFVAGDRLTIADISVFVYAHCAAWCGVDIHDFPYVKAWYEKMVNRPAVQKGLQTPVTFPFSKEVVMDAERQGMFQQMRKYGGQMIKAATLKWEAEAVSISSDHANYEAS